jgi:cobalamin synthase
MEFVDVVLYIIYLAFAVAMSCVVWSAYRRNRRGTGRLAIQNGIRAHTLSLSVWTVLIILTIFSLLIGKSNIVDAIVIMLLCVFSITVLVAFWALIRRK